MPLNAHDTSVALFVRSLTSLKSMLTKGEAHAAASGMAPAELFATPLAPGAPTFAGHVHWAIEGARLAVDRLMGTATAPPAAEAKTFADLHQRLDATVLYLGALDREKLEAGLERAIEVEHRGGTMRFLGAQFLLQLALPGFFFHVTGAYDILRLRGVALTKGDFMGRIG